MRRNHVRRDFYPMISGSTGTDLAMTPGSSPQRAPWSINKIPTRNGKYFAYVPRIWVRLQVTVDQPVAGGSILYDEMLGSLIHSFELRRTKFGNPFLSTETSGARLHNVDNRIASGYRHASIKTASIPAADGDTTRDLWIPLSFSNGCNDKPHHFAPPAALINGSLLDVYLGASDCLAQFSTGCAIKNVTMSVVCEVIWEPEARLFVPVKRGLYEPQASGQTQRWELDLGGRKGLDGVDDSMGAGLLSMLLPSSVAGLGGGFTVNEISKVSASFLNLDQQDYPQLLSMEFINSLERGTGEFYPFQESATVSAAHAASQLFFPLVGTPRSVELSKVSLVKGKQELIMTFSSSLAQKTHKVFTEEAFAWDPNFILAARSAIFGNEAEAAQYVPVQKFLRKQTDDDQDFIDDRKKRLLPWTFRLGGN